MQMIPNGEKMGVGSRKEVKLLVVDETPDHFEHVRLMAEMYSAQFSVECRLAPAFEEAISVLDSWSPSVALVDVHLGASTFGLIQTLAHRGVAVIAVSEVRIPDLHETVQSYGAVGYFPKSDNPDDIETLLGYLASISAVAAAPN